MFGLDACEPMLVQAKMRATALAGRLVQGNAQRLPYASSTADLVLCSMSLGYFENLSAIFKEFARVARPGGSVAVTDVHPDAIAAGWKRSFRSGDVFCEIEHFYYPVETIREAAFRAGLHLLAWADAKLGYPEFPIFRQAGKAQLFHHATKRPALFLAVWERPC